MKGLRRPSSEACFSRTPHTPNVLKTPKRNARTMMFPGEHQTRTPERKKVYDWPGQTLTNSFYCSHTVSECLV